jgi:hypothetical protein
MARMVLRSCAVSIALALVGTVVCAQTPQSINYSTQTAQATAQRNNRIVSLLEQLADQARASEDLAFGVRAQSQAATMLWSQDAEQARAIYRRAFQSLAAGASSKVSNCTSRPSPSTTVDSARALSAAQQRQLRGELLNQIAAHDPQLAEELARGPEDSTGGSNQNCGDRFSTDCSSNGDSLPSASVEQVSAPGRADTERRELLMSAAIQVVERDPQQAMAFAQMSVALGISSNLARFLTLLQSVDAERADLLFANAVARLEQSARVDFREIHTIGSYIVSVVSSPTKQLLSRTFVVRFLNFAFDQIARGNVTPSETASPDESAAFYFVGRQLTDLFGSYLPARMAVLQRYLIDRNDTGTHVQDVDSTELETRAPGDVARDASEATDVAERDSLYARAAMGWLAQGEVREAQAAALKISGDETRDRVLVQIVRRQSSEKRTEDAVVLARRIAGVTTRVDVFVMLGTAALASNDTALAFELLNEAEASLVKASPSIERARSLVRIANSFSGVDTVRGFEALELAVKSINELIAEQQDLSDEPARPRRGATQGFTLDELYAASFEGALAALAKTDFDRALSLAQEFAGSETSVVAQLAVCRGGLVEKAPVERSASDSEAEWTMNH